MPGRPVTTSERNDVHTTTPQDRRPPSQTFASLGDRNFRLFLAGLFVSGTGVWMQRIAQNWLVLTLTDSPAAVGLTTAFQFLPTLLLGLQILLALVLAVRMGLLPGARR